VSKSKGDSSGAMNSKDSKIVSKEVSPAKEASPGKSSVSPYEGEKLRVYAPWGGASIFTIEPTVPIRRG
jgi:hypothetical protein